MQWAGKVVQDVRQRGPIEGLQDLTYPVLMNPFVEPLAEPLIGRARVMNHRAGRPIQAINALLGQMDHQMASPKPKNFGDNLMQSARPGRTIQGRRGVPATPVR